LQWCGLSPDESPLHGGPFAPYRQSERKPLYKEYADKLVAGGFAYYAFDTPADLEAKRKEIPNFQYSHATRMDMKNSLTLNAAEVDALLQANTPYVIRINMPVDETISFTDMIRGEVSFNSTQVDDKVLLKADGMPTYHLAVVVDDYLMKISHAFRGEEWLPSAPVHVLLWKYLFGLDNMPQWAHLPLILKPDGNGKLSKRDGDRLGFPVFAMDWTDPKTGEKTTGFKERGFLSAAFVNMLAMLGWNDGTDREIFTLTELVEKFSMEHVHKAGAKFNFEKAKWFNSEWIKLLPVTAYAPEVAALLKENGIEPNTETLVQVLEMVKDRCVFLNDFAAQSAFFFKAPETIDLASIQPKWNEQKDLFFAELIRTYELADFWNHEDLEKDFKEIASVNGIKPGELMLPLRIMLVGGKFGPHVFNIAEVLGKTETIHRIKHTLQLLQAASA
jgi:glutamyl-tRNA synthetase